MKRSHLLLTVVLAALCAMSAVSYALDGPTLSAMLSPGAAGFTAFASAVPSLLDIKGILVTQGKDFEEYKSRIDQRFENIENHIKTSQRPGGWGEDGGSFTAEDREAKAGFMRYLRGGHEDGLRVKAMRTNSGPDGGFGIPKQIDSEVSRILHEMSPMRRLARVVQVDTGDYSMVHSRGGTGYAWVGETSSRPETNTPQLSLITPPMGEIYAKPAVTQTMLDDAFFDLEGWLIEELGEAFGDGEGDAHINGNGIAKPRGLFTYDVTSEADGVRDESKMQYVASGASGAFASSHPADKLVKLVHTVRPRYRIGAAWLMNSNTLELIRTFKDSTGNYIWRPGLTEGQPSTLLGYPVEEDENVPDIAADSLSIAFGNFQRGYTIVDRSSAMLRDPFTAKPYVLFYTTRRIGGAVRDFRAIKFMKFATS